MLMPVSSAPSAPARPWTRGGTVPGVDSDVCDDEAMRVACVQLSPDAYPDPAARRAGAAELIASVAAVDLLVLPELWPTGFFAPESWAAHAEPGDGPTVEFAAGVARERGCWVHSGSFVERDGSELYNSSAVLGPDGAVVLTYRKAHLFGYQSRESELLTAGNTAGVAPVSGLTIGVATCYDLRFPELFRSMLDAGAELFCITSAWPAARVEHWRLLARARAVENLAWLIACNGAGSDHGQALAGHSLVVDPWGEVVAEADDQPGVLVADIDPDRSVVLRQEYPFLADRAVMPEA